jgi:NAD-dependent dihydropyrimidine dehydrogenase PreA subunit
MGIDRIDLEKCNGCGICRGICPEDVIRMKDRKAFIGYPEDCIACVMCEFFCPVGAISVNLRRMQKLPLPY